MQLMKKWLIFTLILVIPVVGQKEKKLKSKPPKKKSEIEFSNMSSGISLKEIKKINSLPLNYI